MHSALHFDTRPVGLDIAQKGAPLFNQKRCAGTSLADLMAATGLQKDGIYRRFSSKQELATAAFDYSWRKAVGGRLDGVTDVTDSVNRSRKMIGNFVEIRAVCCRRLPLRNTTLQKRMTETRCCGREPDGRHKAGPSARTTSPPQAARNDRSIPASTPLKLSGTDHRLSGASNADQPSAK
jgi:AcrR family transcriptional regulator